MFWIRNVNDPYLLWKNDYGWVNGDEGPDLFTFEERNTLTLPIDGEWWRAYP